MCLPDLHWLPQRQIARRSTSKLSRWSRGVLPWGPFLMVPSEGTQHRTLRNAIDSSMPEPDVNQPLVCGDNGGRILR